MVADELAVELCEQLVSRESRFLDPFCGSGRLIMAAATQGAVCTGLDWNPLACLITQAKAAKASLETIATVAAECGSARRQRVRRMQLKLRGEYKVTWFSGRVLRELSEILSWVNSLSLPSNDRVVVAMALSATARAASFCRKNGWKLHRLSSEGRAQLHVSPWEVFETKLRQYAREQLLNPIPPGHVSVARADARRLGSPSEAGKKFDVIITSPPYGDSQTTIQYGAASALCLEVVSRIDGFHDWFALGRDIDQHCLGGARNSAETKQPEALSSLRPYWAGSQSGNGYARVSRFLHDLGVICGGFRRVLAPGGRIAIVVGRRSVGGYRVKLDEFLIDQLETQGLHHLKTTRRSLQGKRLPRRINKYGRSKNRARRTLGATVTMLDEYILLFRDPQK